MSSLLEEISSSSQLNRAWKHVKRNSNVTAGIDEKSVTDFGSRLASHLTSISKSLKNKSYQFGPVIEAKIAKKSGGKRKIRMYTIADKIVQTSIKISFESKRKKKKSFFPGVFNKISVGFVKDKKGVRTAVERIKKGYSKGYVYATIVDIVSFFDVIDRPKLRKIIKKHLKKDETIDWLIDQALTPEVMRIDRYTSEKSKVPDTGSGVSQGSVLAPLFSNIYLMDFDKKLQQNGILAIRYADDICLLSKSQDDASVALKTIEGYLAKENLTIHKDDEKSVKTVSIKYRVSYLGITLQYISTEPTKGRWVVKPTAKKVKELKLRLNEKFDPKKINSLWDRITSANAMIKSWITTYSYSKCTKRELDKIYSGIKIQYEKNVSYLLQEKEIISKSKQLTSEQLNFLGILSVKEIKRSYK